MEDKELSPIIWARASLCTAQEDLKSILAKTYETYRAITVHAIDIQGYLRDVEQALQDIERQNERPH